MVQVLHTVLTLLHLLASIVSATPTEHHLSEKAKPKLTSKNLQEDIRISTLKAHVDALQKIADKNNGTRFFGSTGYNASVAYVYSGAKKAGYDVQKQSVMLFQVTPTIDFLNSSVQVNSSNIISMHQLKYSPMTPVGGFQAPLVYVPDAVKGRNGAATPGCEAGDYAGVDFIGKVALVQRGACAFALKSENAKTAGAVGIVIYNNLPNEIIQGTLDGVNDTAFVPTAGVSMEIGEELKTALSEGPVTIALNIQSNRVDVWSENVIATSKEGNQTNIIMVGGHLDSVTEGPGINDNGSGAIAVLELATRIANYSLKGKNAVRFAWWTAEEKGLLGSDYYGAQLSEEEKKIALYINLDMVASPNYILGIDDSDNSAGNNTVGAGPPGSGVVEATLQQYFASKRLPAVPTAFNGRSDYASFIGNDIPACGLFTGAEELMTPEQAQLFGGKAGEPLDPNYHGPGDTGENINYDAFEIMVKAAAHAIAAFIDSTKAVEAQKASVTNVPKERREEGEVSTLRDDLGVVRSSKRSGKATE